MMYHSDDIQITYCKVCKVAVSQQGCNTKTNIDGKPYNFLKHMDEHIVMSLTKYLRRYYNAGN